MNTTDDLTQIHIEHLASMFDTYRLLKGKPQHDGKLKLFADMARLIGQNIADNGGSQAMRAFIDRFYEHTKSDDAEDWLYRRWDGIRLPDGSVWVS